MPEFLETREALLRPAHTALIVVDVENGFASDDCIIAKSGVTVAPVRAAVPRINKLVRAARAARVPIVYIQSVLNPKLVHANCISRWGPIERMPIPDFSWETQFYPELAQPRPEDVIVKKYYYDAFSDTPLDLHLRSSGIRTIVLTGCETCACVETTARHGCILGYYVVVAGDCCAVTGTSAAEAEELHRASLRVLARNFATVLTGPEIAETWATIQA